MTRSNSNNMRKTKRPTALKEEEKTNALLSQLLALQKQQTVKETPAVMDVPRIRLARNKVHSFHRSLSIGNITSSATAEVDGSVAVTLGGFPDFSDFTNLFDAYRIAQVSVEFYPLFLDTTATTNYPPIATVIDYDDASSTSYSLLQEYDSLQIVNTGVYFERTFIPRIASAVYSGAFTSFAQSKGLTWIDAASTGVIHYGLKYALPEAGAANPVWSVTVHAIIQCRNSR
jgi:hypothetical protein